jgi:CubicO group peptidase (beta-lactamase class C family)
MEEPMTGTLRTGRFWMLLAALAWFATAAACSDDSSGGGDAGTDADTDTDGDTDTDTGCDPRFDDLLAALEADLEDSTAYGVSMAVMEGGEVTCAQALGSKDPDGEVPLTAETLMQIGSTTKQMTAVALLRNVEAGQVALDDTLEEVLPLMEFTLDETWDDQVTLHHLISHQGGFYDYIPWDGPADDTELADWTYGAYADEFWLMAPPGAFWNYSNPNFVFAGLVSEELDDRAWSDIMVEDLFEPLGMDRTFLRKAEVEQDGDYALSYGLGKDDLYTGIQGPVEMEMMPDPGWARPAGLVWTTPTQMTAWADFLMNGDPDVLGDELRAEVTAEQVDTLFFVGNMHYGYGVFVERGYLTLDGEWYELPVWQHGGNTLSFSNFFYALPEQDFAVAICASGYAVDFSRSVDAAITTLVDLPEPSAPPEYTFDPAALDDHVGTYTDPHNVGDMIVTREGDALFVEMPTLDAYGYDVTPELETVSSSIFMLYLDGYAYDLTFVPETEGEPSTWVRNRLFVTTRVDEATARRQPTLTEVERALSRARLEPSPLRRVLEVR